MRYVLTFILPSLLLTVSGSGAQTSAGAPADTLAALIARIEAGRTAKDSLLRHAPDSPIPAHRRAEFDGLQYFPIDLEYRLIGELHVYGRQRQIRIPTTDGRFLEMERWGRFVARLGGKPFWLEVYRSPEERALLVFFKDATSGEETYGGGRYARLEKLSDGYYLLDFNQAYNPYCAYNPDYVCPLPPSQNHLSIAIRAGERNYGANLAH